MPTEERPYTPPSDTLRRFHESNAKYRCIVGPVGSGKTSAAAMEIGYYLPLNIFKKYGIRHTKWAIIRNTFWELEQTTKKAFVDPEEGWFPGGEEEKQKKVYHIRHNGIHAELVFKSCDHPDTKRDFKSLQITGFLIDESIEVAPDIKRMLKGRTGRFPKKSPVKYGIEITNPPDIEEETYYQFDWGSTPPPGPLPSKPPLKDHVGFWQRPYENSQNLNATYYQDLMAAYRDNPDWIRMYILGEPGAVQRGKNVYSNFEREAHVAKESLVWPGIKVPIVIGWDNTGLTPAAVAACIPTPGRVHVLKEWNTERESVGAFCQRVMADANMAFPGAQFLHPADPAGRAKFGTKDGELTSNEEIMEGYGVHVVSSEINFRARVEAVETLLRQRDGLLIDPSCHRLISGFISGYHYPEIGTTGIFQEQPLKNKYSHCHDALQYVACFLSNTGNTRNAKPDRKRRKLSYRTV